MRICLMCRQRKMERYGICPDCQALNDRMRALSCDPGWVSNQFPPAYEISQSFEPYLTFDDGASRVLYPVTMHMQDTKIDDSGMFYKDYRIIDY